MNNLYFNATQHVLTPSQQKEGNWINLEESDIKIIRDLITFDTIPSENDMVERARKLAGLVTSHCAIAGVETCKVMIGGAPYFQSCLENALLGSGFEPVYSFSERKCIETPNGDIVEKKFIFEHVGWVRPYSTMFD